MQRFLSAASSDYWCWWRDFKYKLRCCIWPDLSYNKGWSKPGFWPKNTSNIFFYMSMASFSSAICLGETFFVEWTSRYSEVIFLIILVLQIPVYQTLFIDNLYVIIKFSYNKFITSPRTLTASASASASMTVFILCASASFSSLYFCASAGLFIKSCV